MAGLNDDFFLADDSTEPKTDQGITVHAFKDSTDNTGEPELRDDLDLIAVSTDTSNAMEELCVQMRDLALLEERVHNDGGMTRSAALEAHNLIPDFLTDDRPAEFFTRMPSRTLLSAALEDIGNEKKNVIRRMIDAIVGFIKKIIKKIKDFFIVSEEEQKANAEFVKNYKGPSPEEMAKAAQDDAAAARSSTNSSSSSTGSHSSQSKPDVSQAADASAAAAPSHPYPSNAGEKESRDKAVFKRLAYITSMLGTDRLAIFAGMVGDNDFHGDYHHALQVCGSMVDHHQFSVASLAEHLDKSAELSELLKKMTVSLSDAKDIPEDHQRELMKKLIEGNHAIRVTLGSYDTTSATDAAFLSAYAEQYFLKVQKVVESLKNSTEAEAIVTLKETQQIIANVTNYLTFLAKIQNVFFTICKGMRKNLA